MVTLAALASILLYFVPLIVLVIAGSFRKRSVLELALDIPLAVSLDLLTLVPIASVFRLDVAALISRALWIVGGAAFVVWKKRTPGTKWIGVGLGDRQLVAVAASAIISAFFSTTLSRTYQIWDRYLHIGLTASLRGQKFPFENVYEPGHRLVYHWAADVSAAMMQALSFCTISSDMALAQAHDVAFACIGATVSLLAIGFGQVRVIPLALAGPAIVLHGPVLLRGAVGNLAVPFHGYSYSHFLTNSFRPHVALAGVMMTGFIGAVAARLKAGEPVGHRRTLGVLFATSAAMTVTDEPSLALLGVALFVTWLAEPKILAPRWKHGLAALVGLAVVVLVARGVFVGFRGGPVEKVAWMPGRIPGMRGGSFTGLATVDGAIVLVCDFFPFLVATMGLIFAFVERPSRHVAAAIVFSATGLLLCFAGVTHLEINGTPSEGLRFFVAPCFASLMLGLFWLPALRRGGLARIALLAALVVPAVFTIYWIRERAEPELGAWTLRGQFESTKRGAYGADCRKVAGSRLGQSPELTYVDTAGWYRYAACRPIFAPGMVKPPWPAKIAVRGQWYPNTQIGDITAMAGPGATVPAMCLADRQSSDPVCKFALANSPCTPTGTDFLRCPLSPDQLLDLQARHIEQDAGWQ